jgi:hypothetical protein
MTAKHDREHDGVAPMPPTGGTVPSPALLLGPQDQGEHPLSPKVGLIRALLAWETHHHAGGAVGRSPSMVPYDGFVEQLPDAITWHRSDDRYPYVASSFRELLGIELAELVDVSPYELFYPGRRPADTQGARGDARLR